MTHGRAVQTGSADQLFERPQHTFVGHFIGSPGMNFLDVEVQGDRLRIDGVDLHVPAGSIAALSPAGHVTLGVRPEYVTVSDSARPGAMAAQVVKAQDIGTHWMVTSTIGERVVRARVSPGAAVPGAGDTVWLGLIGPHTCFYKDDRLLA